MVYEAKLQPTDESVVAFIEQIESKNKRADAFRLLDIYNEVTGMAPVMWGPSIIGYGTYTYTYDSGHSGVANWAGFSPRKTAHTIYFALEEKRKEELLAKLGKHRSSKACLYINKLADVDEQVLREIIKESMAFIAAHYPTSPN